MTTTTFTPRRSGVQMRRNQNSTRFQSRVKLGPVAHTVLVALMITVLGLIYLTQAIKTTAYGYEAQDLDSQISELSAKKSELEVQNARLTSLERAKNSNVAAAMTLTETSYAR
jgi:hypothetical protein cdivTM_20657